MSFTKFVASRFLFMKRLQFQQKWQGISSIYYMNSMALEVLNIILFGYAVAKTPNIQIYV
jgi:hypothetical protein